MCNFPTLFAISNIFFTYLRQFSCCISACWQRIDYNNSLIVMLHAKMYRKLLIMSAFLLIVVTANQGTVVILNQQNLKVALEEGKPMVVYFSQDDCKYCTEFSEIFALVSKLHSQTATLYKVAFTPQSASLFQTYQVESTPTVLAFNDGQLLPYRYEPTGSGNSLSIQFFKWVQRLFLPLHTWEGDDSHAHQLIVHCNTQQFSDFWQEISRNQLWLDVYCGNEDLLKGKLAIVYEYGHQVQAWQLQNDDFEQVSTKLRRLIRAYKYKFVLNWSTAVVQEVFRNNASAFVILVNNETRSRELQGYYQEIKKRWYQNSHNYQPTIFAVADLSLHPAETLELKRYLTGYATFNIVNYYYPIVGFIAKGGIEGKYVLNLTAIKDKKMLQDFVSNIDRHVIRGQPYGQTQEQLVRWLNGGSELSSKEESSSEKNSQEKQRVRKIMIQQEWNDLLINYEKPFFVYFTWRNSHKICKLQRQFADWWEGKEQAFAPHRHAYDIFLHMQHFNDLPLFKDLTVDYFPSLYYFNTKKEIKKLEGVTKLDKIKAFINETFNRENNHSM